MSPNNPYSLALPPRSVPWPIRGQLLFGGFFSQFGWLWLGFTLIFMWVFGGLTGINDLNFLIRNTATASGTITSIESTSTSENETPVYANHFTFRVERLEAEFRGVSYTTGRQFQVGETVAVEYVDGNPDISRIQNTRSGTFSLWVSCLVGIFPAIGFVFVGIGLSSGFKANRLLTHGKVALGTLIDKSPTNTRINNQTVYKLTFEFTADDGQPYQATAKSHTPYLLEDEVTEQLVYDPYRPTRAVLLDSLPGEPDIDEFGNLHVADMGRSIRTLILPAVVLSIHSMIFLFITVYL